jgi:hypothetical protein
MNLRARLTKLEGRQGSKQYVVRLSAGEARLPRWDKFALVIGRSRGAGQVAVLPEALSLREWQTEYAGSFQ